MGSGGKNQPNADKPTSSNNQPDASKRDKWLAASLIIPFIGVLITTGWFGVFLTKPNVAILITATDDRASFKVSNNGETAATHLKLVVTAPAKIISYPYFSTENISLSLVNHTLVGYMPRFAQGAGSIVNINLTISAKPNTHYSRSYEAYATYDQGSSKGVFSKSAWPVDPDLLIGSVIIAIYAITVVCYRFLKARGGLKKYLMR